MFYTLLNYIASQSIALPTHIVDKNTEKKNEDEKKKGTLIWSTNGSNTVYTDLETGLIKYDFYDVLVKGM